MAYLLVRIEASTAEAMAEMSRTMSVPAALIGGRILDHAAITLLESSGEVVDAAERVEALHRATTRDILDARQAARRKKARQAAAARKASRRQ